MTADLGTADAQSVAGAASDEELEQAALSEESWSMAVCQDCDHTGPLRAPSARFLAKEDANDHTHATGHDVDVDQLTPGQVRQFRQRFTGGGDP